MSSQGFVETDLQQPVTAESLETAEETLALDAEVPAPAAEAPAAQRAGGQRDDSSLYIHRELSQLQFNIRVLEQARHESYPLLERLKYLLIFSSNLDEFFEIRVASEEADHLRPRAGRRRRPAAAPGAGAH